MRKFILLLLVLVSIISATNYHVATDGNDAADGSVGAPWLHVDSAWSRLYAGDTLFLREGRYNTEWEYDNKNKGHSGTMAQPIYTKNYPAEACTISSIVGEDSCIFDTGKNWYGFEGIHFIYNGRCIRSGHNTDKIGLIVKNCTFQMVQGGDNTGAIYLENSDSATIVNNIIVGPNKDTAGLHGNTTGIIIFNSTNSVIRHNEIKNSPIGIYYKHGHTLPTYPDPTGIIIDSNLIFDCLRHGLSFNLANAKIRFNAIGPRCGSAQFYSSNGGPRFDHNRIEGNIFVTGEVLVRYDGAPGSQYDTLYSNYFGEGLAIWDGYSGALEDYTISNNNLFENDLIEHGLSEYTLAQWQSASSQDAGSSVGTYAYNTEYQDTTWEYYFGDGGGGMWSPVDSTSHCRRGAVTVTGRTATIPVQSKHSSATSIKAVYDGITLDSVYLASDTDTSHLTLSNYSTGVYRYITEGY